MTGAPSVAPAENGADREWLHGNLADAKRRFVRLWPDDETDKIRDRLEARMDTILEKVAGMLGRR